jgi:DNA-3-methyladenine glycosylase
VTAPPTTFSVKLTPLPRTFFARDTETVARELLGKLIVRQQPGQPTRVARIVEVEAYLGLLDLASHARRGPTPRAKIMFGPPGHLYVYLIYGMYHCMNFVARGAEPAGAVLIRAAEPVAGFEGHDARLLSGPGKLCRGLHVTRAEGGVDLTSAASPLYVARDRAPAPRIAHSARIGIDYAGDWKDRDLRFFVADSPAVSGPRRPRVAKPPTR